MRSFWYWWKVFTASIVRSGSILGWGHPGRWWLPASIVILASGISYFCIGDAKTAADKLIWLACSVAGACAIFSLVFLFTFLTTPPRLAAEAEDELKRLSAVPPRDYPLIRDVIAAYITEGQGIRQFCLTRSAVEVAPAVKEWRRGVHEFLVEKLDLGFAVRFDDFTGLSKNQERVADHGCERWLSEVHFRIVRLTEFLRELPHA